jgi:hypothetical protein
MLHRIGVHSPSLDGGRCRLQPQHSDRGRRNDHGADPSKHNLAAEFLTLEFWAGDVHQALYGNSTATSQRDVNG